MVLGHYDRKPYEFIWFLVAKYFPINRIIYVCTHIEDTFIQENTSYTFEILYLSKHKAHEQKQLKNNKNN